jgi:hypothetical protein
MESRPLRRRWIRNLPLAALCFLPVWKGGMLEATEGARFRFEKPVTPPPTGAHETGSFAIDEEVYAHANEGLTDLRVLGTQAAEVPFLIRPRCERQSVRREVPVAMETVRLDVLPGNRVEVVLKKSHPESRPSCATLLTRERDFEKTVTVLGSLDGQAWTTLSTSNIIFDVSRFMDLRRTRIEWPESRHTWYKLNIDHVVENRQAPLVTIARHAGSGTQTSLLETTRFQRQEFRIDSVQVCEVQVHEEVASPMTRSYPVSGMEVETDTERRETRVTFTVNRIPLRTVTVLTDDTNFSRPVTVEGWAEAAPVGWRPVHVGSLTRIDIGGIHQDGRSIDIPGLPRYARYRLGIQDADNRPIAVGGIQAVGELREVVFLKQSDNDYRLVYGGGEIPAPKYDIGDVLSRVKGADSDPFVLGAEQENPLYDGKASGTSTFLRAKTVLVSAVILMVAALWWLIARSARSLPDA